MIDKFIFGNIKIGKYKIENLTILFILSFLVTSIGESLEQRFISIIGIILTIISIISFFYYKKKSNE
jgi:RsiW-degrading membrane proteinase PrsW (M82 family)